MVNFFNINTEKNERYCLDKDKIIRNIEQTLKINKESSIFRFTATDNLNFIYLADLVEFILKDKLKTDKRIKFFSLDKSIGEYDFYNIEIRFVDFGSYISAIMEREAADEDLIKYKIDILRFEKIIKDLTKHRRIKK